MFFTSIAVAVPIAAWSISAASGPARRTLGALADGVRSFQENDFSLRLAVGREDELGELVSLYNRMGDALRLERTEIYQRELLLDTLLQGAPMAILLVNELGRILYANTAARQLFGASRRLQGKLFDEAVSAAPAVARDALAAGVDTLFTWPRTGEGGEEETYRLVQRRFQLNTQQNRLVVVERITPELKRQEVEVWKKAIRVLSHELNNSLAPVSSLLHSAKHVAGRPEAKPSLEEILDAISERVRHLFDFLEGYARFARLPAPVRKRIRWSELLDSVGKLFPFRLASPLPEEEGWIDPAQIQQVLINLLKNAAEAEGPPEEITLEVQRVSNGWRMSICDRGKGMDEETMRNALLPFYSSKQTGSGLGLPLCTEILQAHGGTLRVERRDGGGIVVTCVLPDAGGSL